MAAATTDHPPTTGSSSAQLAQQLVSHTAPRYSFSFTPFLQRTYQHSLPADRPACKAYQAGHCPLKTRCPDRHVSGAQPGGGPSSSAPSSFGSLVCKHWLRGLCKKGEGCEFLHEYNLRKMPECNFFLRNGYCSNGDECLYLHIDPLSRLPPCPHYERGFCPLGPRCAKRHVRRRLCPCYLAGFCPAGRACRDGAHPRWEAALEPPRPRDEVEAERRGEEEERRAREDAAAAAGGGDRGLRDGDGDGARHDRQGGYKDRFAGGRGGPVQG